MRALSIRQPWAWLIVAGHKDIENRDWATTFRGPVLIHAGKTLTLDYWDEVASWVQMECGIEVPPPEQLPLGGIVGAAEITGCVESSESRWFAGPYGLELRNARALPFVPWRGMLGFFHVPAEAVGLRPDGEG